MKREKKKRNPPPASTPLSDQEGRRAAIKISTHPTANKPTVKQKPPPVNTVAKLEASADIPTTNGTLHHGEYPV